MCAAALTWLIKPNYLFAVIFAIAMLVSIRLFLRLLKESVSLRQGLEGERYTGQELSYLMPEGCWVYHDFPTDHGNIDHVIVAPGGVFTVETKAISKPVDDSERDQSRLATVSFDGETLHFPHFNARAAVNQARIEAKYMEKWLRKRLDAAPPVTPVIALPGWYVDTSSTYTNPIVINPRQGGGGFFRKYLFESRLSNETVRNIAMMIDDRLRTLVPRSKLLDPDADKHFDPFMNQRPK